MFGNLFEDDEEESSSSTPSQGRVSKGVEEPPPPRGRSNLCGIRNQGGTCYLNSLLQTLLFTPEFREELFRLAPDELGCLEDKDKPGAKVRVIPLELQRLFTRLLLVDQQSASTSDLTESFGWNSSEGTNQHDVQELNRILFSALEHSLVGTSGTSFIHRLYHGTIVNSIECKECGNVSQRQEDFMDLTACVCGVSSLEEALWNMFVEEELFEGNNLYRCTRCDRLVTAAKSAKLSKLPPFLTMSLLRFSFDFSKCERYKETGRYTFPVSINLRPFCEQVEGDDSDYSYELFSVIIHKGGCYGGHYHAYIRDIDRLGNWEPPEEDFKLNTHKRVQTTVQTVPEQTLKEDDPLSVLTTIIAQEPLKSVLVDQLGQKLLDKIGSSWSKKFRKQYGPIGKFLQLHKDVFLLVSNGTRVALKMNPPSSQDRSPSPTKEIAPEEQRQGLPEAEPEVPHWFDLNDSTVTPIRESDIEKQFQGKESAYMLFFRKKQLSRPTEALGCPQYKVPDHLVQLAQEENVKLQKMREEVETSNNTIDLRLHLGPSYRLTNGALQPRAKDPSGPTSLSFDRRKTVGELRLTIYQQQELWEGDMVLTVARSLPAGLHLYNTLTDDDISLYAAGIFTNSDLFVWNGREVCGSGVMTGAQWEPLLLTVVRPFLGEDVEPENHVGDADVVENGVPGLMKEARGFAGGATLGEVREALGEPEESLICQEHQARGDRGAGGEGGGASGWRIFPPDDMQRTLKELSLKDGDALLVLEPHSFDCSVFSINGDVVTVTTPSDCRWLQVEFTPRPGETADEKRRIKVPATGSMLLSEVKLRAVEELQSQRQQLPGAVLCLRQVDCAGKLLPPVCEELSVREAGVRLMTTLILCPGVAPKASQLFLNYCVGTPPSADAEMNIVVENTCTVKECLKLMLDRVGLEGSCWHLRRLDWCEEVGEPLMDEDSSLMELKVQSGDTLVITEGQLPPKGFLQLPVWLHSSDPVETHLTDNGPAGDCAAAESVVLQGYNKGALRKIGQVEMSDEVSLEDLKIHVSTLPALQDVCVPTAGFLRVWQLDGRRPARLLRGPQLALRKLKLATGSEICVQHLLKEENLGPKEILLNALMRVPGERSYFPSEELVWDASKDSSARSLRACLAAHYGLSPDSLLLAKHQADRYSWEEISSWNQQVSSKKKKKKADSLLSAPFHLKDGDVIGIKNLGVDTNRDFSTVQDDWGLQRLRELAEQRRKGELAAAAANGDGAQKKSAKSRKPEVGLSINVGEFR